MELPPTQDQLRLEHDVYADHARLTFENQELHKLVIDLRRLLAELESKKQLWGDDRLQALIDAGR